jgi:lysophospholipase L1-like esterase
VYDFDLFSFSIVNSYYRSNLLIVDVGSNDLCGHSVKPKEIACELLNIAERILHTSNVKFINFVQVAPRTSGLRYSNVDQFELDRVQFNTELAALVMLNVNVSFSKMQGLNLENINEWSNDGIHPSTKYGFHLYSQVMRRAVFRCIQCSK